jgi:rod shape-determining protein MreC
MRSKVVRRRRAVLVIFVVLSLGLLTVYFGESSGGTIHTVQRGAMGVLSPIQEGANTVLKPFRDLFNWVGDTWDAKGERDKLKRERDALRREVAELHEAKHENAQMSALLSLDKSMDLERAKPITGRVISRSPNAWYATVEINRGTSDGIRVGHPVINGEGLVGRVKAASGGSSVIALITDRNFAISAKTSKSNEPGTLAPAFGSPGSMVLDLVSHGANVKKGETVITAGTTSSSLPSHFPKGIIIGRITKVEEGDSQLERKIHVTPTVDLRRLELVQVLTAHEGLKEPVDSGADE